ncbi:MucR family transcriptional regulator [Methylobacterium sp. NMS14P]|uniref:MucR family transcriptional regulator n=1 Tax=Methylobacterium sp. NMS14P TaxID=2894310 RepID=UPI00235A41CD|nr:MucR family transcriptional regulator [Methylobacterium sp. NMS14P]WCS27260.1 MucR family transcriptional regulator [Methylobacterium sp. NMS14P]
MDMDHAEHVSHAVGIVTAYVGQHHVPAADLPGLIASVHRAVAGLGQPAEDAPAQADKPTKKQIDASVRRDAIISFIDGKPYKTLKRHLTKHGLDARGYRERFGLPDSYPLVAADYAVKRSALAKAAGLGAPRQPLQAVA